MPETKHCAECGAALPTYWPKGLCTQCALDGALDLTHAASQIREPKARTITAADFRPPASSPEMPELGSFGEYDLLEEIARGGMGVVYKARQRNLGRIVAVKMILAGPLAGKEFVQRFRTEASAAAILQHPNIVAIHEVGVHEGRHYFSMDYVEGPNLRQLVGQQPLPAARAARYVARIAEAIHYAHARGILHRDLKPSNVLIDANDQPRITDFGLAKRLDGDSSLTMTGQVLGSPNFMPPEQAGSTRSKVGRPSDVYALGGILYYLLTARAPFQAESLEQIIAQVLNAEPVAPCLLNASIPRDLETITLKCLGKEPARRYQTAQELADELGRVLRQEPIRARPINAPEKFWRWCRRKPAFASAVGFAIAALLTGFATTAWQWRRAEHQRLLKQQDLYVATMNTVQAAWEGNTVSRIPELLQVAATDSERGFEWYYWQRQLHQELKAFRVHDASLLAVAYSPDGRRIVTGGADGTACVWDVATGKALQPLRGHSAPIRSVAFSPDGQRVVTGSWDRTAKVWSAFGGAEPLTLTGHTNEVFSVAFSPDGQRIATGSFDQTIRVWDAFTGASLLTLQGHSNRVWAVAYSLDGDRIASGGWDQTVRIWDARTGTNLFALRGDAEAVLTVAFSPDGKRLVTGGLDHTAKIWDLVNGTLLFTLKGHRATIFSANFSLDGRRIATAGDDQTAKVWDSATGEELFALRGHGSRVSSVGFSPDGKQLVTAGGGVTFSPGSQFLDTLPGDHTAKIWDASGSKEVRIIEGHANSVWTVVFSADGRKLASSSYDGTARIWDVVSGQPVWTLADGHTDRIRAVAFSPDGQRIVTASYDHTAKVWDLSRAKEPLALIQHAREIHTVAFSPDGQRIATGSWDQTVRIWEAATGKKLLPFTEHKGYVFSVAFSPGGQHVLNGDGSGVWKIWDAATGAVAKSVAAHNGYIRSAVFSPDGRRIATGSDDGTARVWDARSGMHLLELKGHTAKVMSVAFSPDGKRILTGSMDQTVKLWDAASGKELLTFKHDQSVFSVAFSPDGRRIASGSGDRLIRVWEAASPEQVEGWRREAQEAADRSRAEPR